MVLRNAMLCSQNMPKQKWLQSISMLSLNNDTVKTGTAFWRHFVHEDVRPSYCQKSFKTTYLNLKAFSSHQGIHLKDIIQVWI